MKTLTWDDIITAVKGEQARQVRFGKILGLVWIVLCVLICIYEVIEKTPVLYILPVALIAIGFGSYIVAVTMQEKKNAYAKENLSVYKFPLRKKQATLNSSAGATDYDFYFAGWRYRVGEKIFNSHSEGDMFIVVMYHDFNMEDYERIVAIFDANEFSLAEDVVLSGTATE